MAKELEDRIEEKEYGRIGSIAGRSGILDIKDSLATLEKYFKTLAFWWESGDISSLWIYSDSLWHIQYFLIEASLNFQQLEEDSMVQPASLDEDAVLRDGDVMISMMVDW